MQTWHKLIVSLPENYIQTVEELLEESEALAVTLESAQTEEIFEPPPGCSPLWQQTRISALFSCDINLDTIVQVLKTSIPEAASWQYQFEEVEEQNWQQNCQNSFKGQCYADKLWVYPSWSPPAAEHSAYVLLDPGLAFGTGAHPTTALCLEWLAKNIIPGQVVMDYGCGSGILAIAAIKLGAKKAIGVDIDPQAIEATRENARRNQITENQLESFLIEANPAQNFYHQQVDVLIANILANPLITLAETFSQQVKKGGYLVLSGILTSQIEIVAKSYQPWFIIETTQCREEWASIAAIRKGCE